MPATIIEEAGPDELVYHKEDNNKPDNKCNKPSNRSTNQRNLPRKHGNRGLATHRLTNNNRGPLISDEETIVALDYLEEAFRTLTVGGDAPPFDDPSMVASTPMWEPDHSAFFTVDNINFLFSDTIYNTCNNISLSRCSDDYFTCDEGDSVFTIAPEYHLNMSSRVHSHNESQSLFDLSIHSSFLHNLSQEAQQFQSSSSWDLEPYPEPFN